jgi:hypothetical protein
VRAAGPVLGAGLVTCGLLAASLLSEARLGEGAVPAAGSPDPAALSLAAATVVPATTGPATTGPATTGSATTAPTPVTPPAPTAPPTTVTTAPTTVATATITGAVNRPIVGVEPAAPAAWGGVLPDGALSVGTSAAVPVGIRIDAVGVAAAIIPVGTTEDQQLELPADADTVAWYRAGPIPGDSGSSLLAAHVDYHGRKGVFFDLERLEPGTRIEVDMSDGSVRAFATSGPAVRHPKYALPLDQVFRRGGARELTLVTCGGRFDASRHSYEDNTVVVAAPA